MKHASIIVIGNEILSGRTQDKNVQYIAIALGKIGVVLKEVRIIPDVENTIIDTVNHFRQTYDYVFTTGGIGPTHDDITSASVAKAFDKPLIENQEAIEKLHDFYQGDLTDARRSMAMTPEGASLVYNPISAAPGFCMDNVYVLAGIPNIMQAMIDSIVPTLSGGPTIYSEERSAYASESKIAAPLSDLQNRYADIDIGSYPFVKDNKVGVSIVLRGTNHAQLKTCALEVEKILNSVC